MNASSELAARAVKEILEEGLLSVGPGGVVVRKRHGLGAGAAAAAPAPQGQEAELSEQQSGRTASAGATSIAGCALIVR